VLLGFWALEVKTAIAFGDQLPSLIALLIQLRFSLVVVARQLYEFVFPLLPDDFPLKKTPKAATRN